MTLLGEPVTFRYFEICTRALPFKVNSLQVNRFLGRLVFDHILAILSLAGELWLFGFQLLMPEISDSGED